MNKTWYKRAFEPIDKPIMQLSPEEWLGRIKEWMGELFGMDKTVFLQYLTASPEIKNNIELTLYWGLRPRRF